MEYWINFSLINFIKKIIIVPFDEFVELPWPPMNGISNCKNKKGYRTQILNRGTKIREYGKREFKFSEFKECQLERHEILYEMIEKGDVIVEDACYYFQERLLGLKNVNPGMLPPGTFGSFLEKPLEKSVEEMGSQTFPSDIEIEIDNDDPMEDDDVSEDPIENGEINEFSNPNPDFNFDAATNMERMFEQRRRTNEDLRNMGRVELPIRYDITDEEAIEMSNRIREINESNNSEELNNALNLFGITLNELDENIIKNKFKALVLNNHPDKRKTNIMVDFNEAVKAKELLINLVT